MQQNYSGLTITTPARGQDATFHPEGRVSTFPSRCWVVPWPLVGVERVNPEFPACIRISVGKGFGAIVEELRATLSRSKRIHGTFR